MTKIIVLLMDNFCHYYIPWVIPLGLSRSGAKLTLDFRPGLLLVHSYGTLVVTVYNQDLSRK